jgi:hypothetical protein
LTVPCAGVFPPMFPGGSSQALIPLEHSEQCLGGSFRPHAFQV